MPMIDEAFRKTGLSLDDIKLLVCGLGPGSFTGVRIGIATSKAFADSKNLNCVGVSSLEALAYNLNKEGYICSLIDAGHDNVYAGLFNIVNQNSLLQTLESDFAFLNLKDDNTNLNSNVLLNFLEKNSKVKLNGSEIYFVGNATVIYKNLLQSLCFENGKEIILAQNSQNIISSISIAKAGYTKYKNGNYGNSNILSPIYLRKSQAELALEEKI